jgi:hypothetical protein
MDHLAILSQTIADHARKIAFQEWISEYGEFWQQILTSAGLTISGTSTLEVDGHAIPIESITKALRQEFLKVRVAQLIPKLTDSVVETAFKKVATDEQS